MDVTDGLPTTDERIDQHTRRSGLPDASTQRIHAQWTVTPHGGERK